AGEEKPAAELETKDEDGATEETGDKAEFSDPNMQAKFTQRMQEFSEKEKGFTAGKQKQDSFDLLMSDSSMREHILKWDRQRTGQEEPEPEVMESISDDEFNLASTDKNAFQTMIDGRSRQVAEKTFMPMIKQLQTKMQTMRSEQDIDDFVNAKDDEGKPLHPDFWELDKAGKIEPHLKKFRNSNMSGSEMIDTAYKMAKYSGLKAEAVSEANSGIAAKKQAIGDKGSKTEAKRDTSKLSLRDVWRKTSKELGINPP
ncbi:hypothetical protein LCGC14_1413700, partial [marine sediment metagenome]